MPQLLRQARELTHLLLLLTAPIRSLFVALLYSSNIDPTTFQISFQTLKPIASQLHPHSVRVVDDDVTWRDRLERAVLDIPLLVDVLLASKGVFDPIHIKLG